MCTIKRAGRWGDSSPSAFYLLDIINDQFLFLIRFFRKHQGLIAVSNSSGSTSPGQTLQSGSPFPQFPFTGRSLLTSHLSHILEVISGFLPSLSLLSCLCLGASLCPMLSPALGAQAGSCFEMQNILGLGKFKSLVKNWWKIFFLALWEVGHTDMRQTHAWSVPSSVCTEEVPLSWQFRLAFPQPFPGRQQRIHSCVPVLLSCSCGSWSACAYTPTQIKGLTSATCTK